MRYSHRNGETEPATEPGWYWVQWEDVDEPYRDIIYFESGDEEDFVNPTLVRWWGPVVPPWEQANLSPVGKDEIDPDHL